eukprot:513926_1
MNALEVFESLDSHTQNLCKQKYKLCAALADKKKLDDIQRQALFELCNHFWCQIQSVPDAFFCSNPVIINNEEFIVVGCGYLHKYNIITNKWSNLEPPENIELPESICFDQTTQDLYCCSKKTINIFNLQYSTNTNYPNLMDITHGSHACCSALGTIIINSELHLICPCSDVKHLVWNQNTKEFRHIHTFKQFTEKYEGFGLVYISSKKTTDNVWWSGI